MSAHEIQEIELNIKQAQAFVDAGKALERLQSNRDFKKIVMEGYFKEEAIRLVHLKGDFSQRHAPEQEMIAKDMHGIAAMNQYFNMVFARADHAERAIEADENTLDEMRSEGHVE